MAIEYGRLPTPPFVLAYSTRGYTCAAHEGELYVLLNIARQLNVSRRLCTATRSCMVYKQAHYRVTKASNASLAVTYEAAFDPIPPHTTSNNEPKEKMVPCMQRQPRSTNN